MRASLGSIGIYAAPPAVGTYVAVMSVTGLLILPAMLLWALDPMFPPAPVTGFYFAFPESLSFLQWLDPTEEWLFRLSELHFGRFNRFTEILWAVLGLVPGVLAFTGAFICCRRVLFKKPSNPYR